MIFTHFELQLESSFFFIFIRCEVVSTSHLERAVMLQSEPHL